MVSNKLPVNSDCYAAWELDDQTETYTYAKITITPLGQVPIVADTDGTDFEILTNPKRLRLKINKGQITTNGVARVEVIAVDGQGNEAKRHIEPHLITFW